jgi:DNA replication protein DnaC
MGTDAREQHAHDSFNVRFLERRHLQTPYLFGQRSILMNEISIPFDEFEHPSESVLRVPHGPLARWTQTGLRIISFAALWVAILSATLVLLGHVMPLIIGSKWPIFLKSGVPLIAIGISYLTLVLTLPRKPGQFLVGILMGFAFVFWGSEQFLTDRMLISSIDDCVVFLFVVDLSIVIRHNFRECAGERRVRKARLPGGKTIESFNFAAQPTLDEGLVRTLLQGKYIDRRENVLIVGNPGTGKTHLATALGYSACMQGKQVLYTTASELVSELVDAYGRHRRRLFLRRLAWLDLLIIDEIGYVTFSEMEAHLLFEVLRTGYERTSLIVATTVPLEKWGELFGSEIVARAAADRLSDRGHLLKATGDSYRKPGRKAVVTPKFREG